MFQGAMELLIKWNLELAFAEKGNTGSQEMSVGLMDTSHCLQEGKQSCQNNIYIEHSR